MPTISATFDLAADGLPPYGFVRLPQILAVLPFARSTLLGWVQEGKFPKPVKIGSRAVAWRVEDVRALLAGCQAVTEPNPNALKAVEARKAKAAAVDAKTRAKTRAKRKAERKAETLKALKASLNASKAEALRAQRRAELI